MSSEGNRADFIGDPWWKTPTQPADYTKRRTGTISWTMDDIIGRKDVTKWSLTTSNPADVTTTSGTILKG